MKKIAIDIRNIGKGRTGDEVVFFELVRNLAIIDQDNEYKLLIDKRSKKEIQQITNDLGIYQKKNFSIIQLNTGNKFIWNGWKMAEYCAQEKIDIYHTQYIIPFFLPASTKIITHIHDVSFKVHKELISKKDAFFLNYLIPRVVRKSDKIIAVSQFTKDEIIKYYEVNENKIEVVYNAVNIEDKNKDFMQIKQKYKLPEKYILAIGTMQPRKNIPFLIKSFAQLSQQKKDINLVLVGKKAHNFDNTISKTIEQFPEIKKKIFFTGYVDENDKFGIFQNAKLFVSPSVYEGFGVPILEAFEAGTLAVISDIEPYREVGGEGVIYFDPYNIDQCVKTLYDSLDNDKMKELVLENARLQKNRFSWLESTKKLKDIYETI
jgi:glycosyltransferase involved in cell wall biosynthesis